MDRKRSSQLFNDNQILHVDDTRICRSFLFRQCEEAMSVLQNDNEQLEQEKSTLKERLKQLTKNKLVDDLMQKKIGGTQRTSGLLSLSRSMHVRPLSTLTIAFNRSNC
jgi:hypothetical protein